MPTDHLGGGYNAGSQAPPAEPSGPGARESVCLTRSPPRAPAAGDRGLLFGKSDQHVGCPVSGSVSALSPGSL